MSENSGGQAAASSIAEILKGLPAVCRSARTGLFNVPMVVVAVIAIAVTVPKEGSEAGGRLA